MMSLRFCAAAILALSLTMPVQAADAIYPVGSRVGLVPLDGLTPSKNFRGFEDIDAGVKIAIAELAANVFTSIDASAKDNQPLPANAIKPESFETASGRKSYLAHESAMSGDTKIERFSLVISGDGFSGYVAVELPEKAAQTYPERAIRTMLASTTVRMAVPVDEQLSVLPFKVTETAGFRSIRGIPPGGAVLLSDAEGDSSLGGPPYIIVSLAPMTPPSNDDRGRLARDLAQTIPGLKNVRFISAEPMRIAGRPGYEVRLEATTAKDDKDVTLVQWLRFGTGGMLRMVAIATREDWPQAFPRFRSVRDGINPQP